MKRNRLTNLIFALTILAIFAIFAAVFIASMPIGELALQTQTDKQDDWTTPILVVAIIIVAFFLLFDWREEKAHVDDDEPKEYVWIDPDSRESLNQLRKLNSRQTAMRVGRIPSNHAGAHIVIDGSPSKIGHKDFEHQMLVRDFIRNADDKFDVEFTSPEDQDDRWSMGNGLKFKTRNNKKR